MAILYQGSQFFKGNVFVDPKGNKLIFEKNTKNGKLFKTDNNHLIGLTESQVNKLKLLDEEKEDTLDIDLRKERVLFLSGEISHENVGLVIERMLDFDMFATEDITLCINSIGGAITAGLAVYDVMNIIKSDVITVCIGECSSMGAIIFMGGTKGKRYILPNSEIMIHQASTDFTGKYSEVERKIESFKNNYDKVLNIISEKTGKSVENIKKDILGGDKYFNSSSAVEYGFADKILYSIDELYK